MRTLQRTGWWSERGQRPSNEDAALSLTLADDAELVAVADGMGGHAAGEVASRAALEALSAALRGGAGLREAVLQANAAVRDLAEQDPERAGMGTTLVVLLRRGERYEVANVGDSRAYRLDGAGLRQLTHDHSFAAEVVRRGEMTDEEAARSPWKNALTRAVGGQPDVEVDLFGPFDAGEPHTVLLCTDGVYRVLGAAELAERLGGGAPADTAARALADDAIRAGSEDNVTAAVVVFGGWGEAAEGAARTSAAAEPAPFARERATPVHREVPDRDPASRTQHPPRRSRAVWRWRMLEGAVFLVAILLLLGLMVGLVFFMD